MPMIDRRLVVATAVAGACAAAPAGAAAQVPPVPDITDAAFLAAAAQSNRFEIVTGRLAARRGHSGTVRRLGRQFRRHHRTQLALGSAVAARLGIPVPPGLNAQQRLAVERLRARRGWRFDRLWVRIQLRAHLQASALHVRAGVNGDTPQVRALAVTALPVIGLHYGELRIVSRRYRRG